MDALYTGVEGLIQPPLEFTRHLAGALQSHVIGALDKPLPQQDPLSAYRYLNARRQTLVDSVKQRPLIRMQDKNYKQLATLGGEMSCVTEEVAADSGEAVVVLRGGDYLGDFVRNAVRIEEDLHLSVDPIPSKPSWKTRWGGKITTINVKRDSSGVHTVELVATSNRQHLKHILIGSTPLLPPEVQPIKMWMLPANIRTGCFITLFINLLRLFNPIASIPTNIANPGGWISPLGPDALLNLSPLQWPIQPQFVNPLLDQSRTSLIAAAWNTFHDATIDPLKDAGCTARVYTYFTDDVDNPHPELEKAVGKELANLARPQRNCLIAAFEDHSGYEGPTGTFADGIINFFATTLDDLITTTVFPVDADDDGEVDPVFRKLFMVAPKPPWAVYRDGQHSGIIESGYHQHKGPVKTAMIYGKSPRIVNDLQTFFIRYGISQIAQVVLGTELPAVEGLDNLYQGQLDNILLAGQRYSNPLRALYSGDMVYQEQIARPNGTAYTISSVLDLRLADFKKRAYRAFKTSIRNGAPYLVHYDFELDDRVGFEQDGILYVDQISAIRYEYDRQKPITYTVSVGDDTKDRDPFAQGIKALQAVYSVLSMSLGEGWLFG
ncbi:hypothetical protein [Mycolicibacterium litorale]|uniref:Gp37-like protein n=1 Tax=Mycolicibacterium litorale TaxID=758802 RepID=UPI001E31B35E|nr:hypothetical protein [Mycolicibacterium litorale]